MTSPIAGLGAGIQRRSTTEQATDPVRQAILSGRLLPGTPLREAALAAELGISRSTLREAARILESEGLVRYRMNRGIVVADVTGPDITDIYAARAAAELAAADALTTHRDPAVYASLADLVDRIEHAFGRGDTAAVLDGDRLFHATLVAAAGSPRQLLPPAAAAGAAPRPGAVRTLPPRTRPHRRRPPPTPGRAARQPGAGQGRAHRAPADRRGRAAPAVDLLAETRPPSTGETTRG